MSNRKPPPLKKPKYTAEQFIIEAKKIHGNRYDYSEIVHPTLSGKIDVVCHKHGKFTVKGQHHLSGSNCKRCVNEDRSGSNSLAFQKALNSFIAPKSIPDAKLIIGSKVEFRCLTHGVQTVSLYWFNKNQQCPQCRDDQKLSLLNSWQLYHKMVWKFTETTWKNKRGFIDHYNKGRSKFGFHLDHQYSVKQGFEDSIPPFVIGHWSNLWLIPYNENSSKGSNCSVSKELLLSNYYNLKRKFG